VIVETHETGETAVTFETVEKHETGETAVMLETVVTVETVCDS